MPFRPASHQIPGNEKRKRITALKQDFNNPEKIYSPFMFWFWDEPLGAGGMAEMSRVMASQGFNPGGFPTQTARYIRITQTGANAKYHWSIYEIDVCRKN